MLAGGLIWFLVKKRDCIYLHPLYSSRWPFEVQSPPVRPLISWELQLLLLLDHCRSTENGWAVRFLVRMQFPFRLNRYVEHSFVSRFCTENKADELMKMIKDTQRWAHYLPNVSWACLNPTTCPWIVPPTLRNLKLGTHLRFVLEQHGLVQWSSEHQHLLRFQPIWTEISTMKQPLENMKTKQKRWI